MCLVIDTNVWCSVFRTDSISHAEYSPVLKWITTGPGFIVYGGTKYATELRKAPRYAAIFLELKKKGRVKLVDGSKVDADATRVEQAANTARCNDAHLIAIFCVSGCRLLCSNDQESDEFIKDKAYYTDGQKPPSIYRSVQHSHLLCRRNIVRIRNEI